MAKSRRTRIPKLRYTALRGIGWHVAYRDPVTDAPRKHSFGRVPEAEARSQYRLWLIQHLQGQTAKPARSSQNGNDTLELGVVCDAAPGSVLHVASSWLTVEQGRIRKSDGPRARGTISDAVYRDRRKQLRDFLEFMNERHGSGAVGRMRLRDLSMADVEEFNRGIVRQGYSASQVNKRMQIVKAVIDRAGRPEHGGQTLPWNWDSRDTSHGKPTQERTLPSLEHLQGIIAEGELRERTMIWLAIGLGFGQRDLAALRVGQIDAKSYDLRRGKTAIERYGETPQLVWAYLTAYLKAHPRSAGELMFVTRKGLPVVHAKGDSVQQWWHKARKAIGESKETMAGFYVLRHVGATEFGSRAGSSIGDVRRWLGHTVSSRVADVYMRPVSPEQRKLIEWVRKRLNSSKLD